MVNQKKSPYPTLTQMGVESPKQIDKFYITSINQIDVLRVVYDRPEESFLPSTRTYKFPRVQDTSKSDGAMRSHPRLRAALAELKTVLDAKTTKESIAAEILGEIELLEEDIAIRSECLKVLVSKIPAVD